MNSVEAAIAVARNAAANLPAQVAGVPGGAVAPVAGGAPITLDNLMAGSMTVEAWLKVTKFGINIGADRKIHSELKVGLEMSQIGYCMSIKGGNPPQYRKTYDNVTCTSGGSWADAQVAMLKIDPKAKPFRSADIPFYVLEDIPASGKGAGVLVEAGKQVGHSLSTTNWANFQNFVKNLQKKGIDPYNAKVVFTLGFEERKNNAGNEWGVLTFADAEEVDNFGFDSE